MQNHSRETYSVVFKEYPDVLDAKQVGKLLSISTKTVYKLIREEKIPFLKVGRVFRISKMELMKYMCVLGKNSGQENLS